MKMLAPKALAVCVALFVATEAAADFVLNNLRMTLYHEVGHSVIDLVPVPLFGPEENAADSFAMVLADRLHSEAEMQRIIVDITRLGRIEAENTFFDPWEEYQPGPQRLSTAICLFYGLNPDIRRVPALVLGMPPDKETACREYGQSVRVGWGRVLDGLAHDGTAVTLKPAANGKALRILGKDIAALNRHIKLPKTVPIEAEACHEDNAFYYHYDDRIVMCHEMVDALRGHAQSD